MKNYRKLKKEIKKHLDYAVEWFESMEWESAPSGEWAEYNQTKLTAQAAMDAWENAYYIVSRFR